VKQKMISAKAVLNASQFCDLKNIGNASKAADTEDLFPSSLYVSRFNQTFSKLLGGTAIIEAELPPGDRIIDRLERYVEAKGIKLRPSGGFNHYAVASNFVSVPPASLDADTLKRFEELFKAVNALL
jgi:hypothetical protein